MKPIITFGFLGSTLDRAQGAERWSKWRPTIAMCQQEDLLISRLELLVEPKFVDLAKSVVADIAKVSPETSVVVHEFALKDPLDFQEVYERLYDFVRGYDFQPEKEDSFTVQQTLNC